MIHPLSIKFKLTLWYLFFLLIVLLFFSIISYLILSQNLYHTNQDTLNTTVFNVQNPTSNSSGLTSENNLPGSPGPYRSLLVYDIDKDRLQKMHSENTVPLSVSVPQGMISINQRDFITPEMNGDQEIWLYYRPSMSQPGYFEILAVTQPKAEVINLIVDFKSVLLISIPLTLVLASCLGYLLVKRMLKPIDEITHTAQEIQKQNLNRRIEIKNNDELGKLSLTLNQAFEHLQKSLERQRQFTNDASHELQTPLAIVQGEATLALTQERSKEEYQKALDSISQESSRIITTVSKLLMLARADSGTEILNLTKVNLKEFLGDIAEDMGVLSEKKQIKFQSNLSENLIVNGDEMKLRELFLNLLDNAIKYTPSDGKISLSLSKQNDMAKVVIKDSGIGISEEHLPHIFERFYRVNKTHSENDEGTGLGLAICEQIVELHNGKIEVTSQVGKGSIFIVTLPLADKTTDFRML
jgi:heavy metal sensor kinase